LAGSLGFPPFGLPKQAALAPYWSTSPIRELKKEAHYNTLQLDDVIHFGSDVEDQTQIFKPRTTKRG